MGLTNDIATAVSTKVAAVSGMRGCSARDPDTIAATPWAVVGLPRLVASPGSWERLDYVFPLRVYAARTSDGPRVTQTVYDTFDAVFAALRTGIAYGLSASGVAEGLLGEVQFDRFWEVGGEIYAGFEGELTVTVVGGRTYTA